MKTIKINTKTLFEKGHITGNTIHKDFCRSGYITVSFNIFNDKLIAVDVNGFEVISRGTYVKKPKNKLVEFNNQCFIKRWFADLEIENQNIIVNNFCELV